MQCHTCIGNLKKEQIEDRTEEIKKSNRGQAVLKQDLRELPAKTVPFFQECFYT